MDYSKPNGRNQQCSNGWYSLPRNGHPCRKCSARRFDTCMWHTSNEEPFPSPADAQAQAREDSETGR
jgi:hypothetical protein